MCFWGLVSIWASQMTSAMEVSAVMMYDWSSTSECLRQFLMQNLRAWVSIDVSVISMSRLISISSASHRECQNKTSANIDVWSSATKSYLESVFEYPSIYLSVMASSWAATSRSVSRALACECLTGLPDRSERRASETAYRLESSCVHLDAHHQYLNIGPHIWVMSVSVWVSDFHPDHSKRP